MKFLRCGTLAFVLAVLSPNGTSQDSQGFLTWGRGAHTSCGAYVGALEKFGPNRGVTLEGEFFASPAGAVMQWIDGFISGVNFQRFVSKKAAIGYKGDANEVALWIKNWCEQHRTDTLAQAATEFVYAHQ